MQKYLLTVVFLLFGCSHLPHAPDATLQIDHILYAGPNLNELINEIKRQSGLQPQPVGQHPDLGTHNSSIPLENSYLELIAPDPQSKLPGGAKVLGIGSLKRPTLIAWAARVEDFDKTYQRFLNAKIKMSPVLKVTRKVQNGTAQEWRYFFVDDERFADLPRINPFFIEQKAPSTTSTKNNCKLLEFRATHPNPEKFQFFSTVVDIKIQIAKGPETALQAKFQCPKGIIELR